MASTAKTLEATERLLGLTSVQLKSLAKSCGTPIMGKKAMVAAELLNNVASHEELWFKPFRFISLDMGIKNIGVTRLYVPSLHELPSKKPVIEEWYRGFIPEPSMDSYPELASNVVEFASKLIRKDECPIDGVILEHQRFRSSNGHGIFNQVMKVNVMEGMMLATFKALFPDLFLELVLPSRVVHFCKPEESVGGKAQLTSKTIAKHVRRDLVASWIVSDYAKSPIDFAHGVLKAAESIGKRDDIDDSLVQAYTWLCWNYNRQRLVRNIESKIDPWQGMITSPSIPRPVNSISSSTLSI